MLLNLYHSYLAGNGNPKNLPRWNKTLDDIERQTELHIQKLQQTLTTTTSASALISRILHFIDIDEYNKYEDDSAFYINWLSEMRDVFTMSFDFTRNANYLTDTFISKDHGCHCHEYLVPVQHKDLLTNLPFDEPFESWKKIKPLYFLNYDSDELSLNLHTGQLKFKYDQPTFALIGIDGVALVFKYLKWREEVGDTWVLAMDNQFIYHHVIIPSTYSILDAWLTRYVSNIILTETNFTPTNLTIAQGKVISSFKNGSLDIQELRVRLEHKQMSIKDMFDTKVLLKGSLRDRLLYLDDRCGMPINAMNYTAVLLRDIPLLEFIEGVHQLRCPDDAVKTSREYTSYRTKFKIEYQKLMNYTRWDRLKNKELIDKLKLRLQFIVTGKQ